MHQIEPYFPLSHGVLRVDDRYAVCDGNGRPLVMLLSEGQISDYKGAATLCPRRRGA